MRILVCELLYGVALLGCGRVGVEGKKMALVEELPLLMTLYPVPFFLGAPLVVHGIYDSCYNVLDNPLYHGSEPPRKSPFEPDSDGRTPFRPSKPVYKGEATIEGEEGFEMEPLQIKSIKLGGEDMLCEVFTDADCGWDPSEEVKGRLARVVVIRHLTGLEATFKGVRSLRCKGTRKSNK